MRQPSQDSPSVRVWAGETSYFGFSQARRPGDPEASRLAEWIMVTTSIRAQSSLRPPPQTVARSADDRQLKLAITLQGDMSTPTGSPGQERFRHIQWINDPPTRRPSRTVFTRLLSEHAVIRSFRRQKAKYLPLDPPINFTDDGSSSFDPTLDTTSKERQRQAASHGGQTMSEHEVRIEHRCRVARMLKQRNRSPALRFHRRYSQPNDGHRVSTHLTSSRPDVRRPRTRARTAGHHGRRGG